MSMLQCFMAYQDFRDKLNAGPIPGLNHLSIDENSIMFSKGNKVIKILANYYDDVPHVLINNGKYQYKITDNNTAISELTSIVS